MNEEWIRAGTRAGLIAIEPLCLVIDFKNRKPLRDFYVIRCGILSARAGVAQLADAPDLKSGGRKAVKVQFLSPAPLFPKPLQP
jgi:hypothetical protein